MWCKRPVNVDNYIVEPQIAKMLLPKHFVTGYENDGQRSVIQV